MKMIAISLFFICLKGGLFFAKPMRENNYISMMDPFQRKYGKVLTAVLSITPVITEVVWIPVLLNALGTCGTTLNLIMTPFVLSLNPNVS